MPPEAIVNLQIDEFFRPPQLDQLAIVTVRLGAAAVIGAVLGAEREVAGKPAGLRTHMLVSLGAATFALVSEEFGPAAGDVGRVIQGVATGIGFIGAGTILKRADQQEISGLTTAATIWLTAALGLAAGIGRLWLSVVCVLFAWAILFMLNLSDRRTKRLESKTRISVVEPKK